MKKYLIFLLLYIPQIIFAQEYVNKIVPTTFGNINAFNIFEVDNQYWISGIFGDNKSTIITLDKSLDQYQFYSFDSFSFSYRPLTLFEDEKILYGKSRHLSKDLKLLMLNANFETEELCKVSTSGNFNFPSSSSTIDSGQNIYGSYNYDDGEYSKFGIFAATKYGSIIWNKAFDNNIKKSILWKILISKSKHLLCPYSVGYIGEIGAKARVLKIDSLGNEIWKSDIIPDVFNINSRISLVELSDLNIFFIYEKNVFLDPEFVNYKPYPPSFIWLDKYGKKTKETILKIDLKHDILISEMDAGKGDYFFVYGQVSSRVDQTTNLYGFITKYANNGDTIWSHTYRHPSYNQEDYFHYINDLIEEDNGDLTVLGSIAPIGGKNEVWVFRVNSEGCFGTDSCDQFTLADHDVILPDAIEISCYPNPTNGIVTLTGLAVSGTYTIHIYSIGGWLMDSYKERNPSNIDLGHLDSGVYVIQISDKKITYTLKVVKQ